MTKSELSNRLYQKLKGLGYPESFCNIISNEMCTEFTANRMMAYLSRAGAPPMEEVADEMFAILSDRDRIIQKKALEHSQSVINSVYSEQNLDAED